MALTFEICTEHGRPIENCYQCQFVKQYTDKIDELEKKLIETKQNYAGAISDLDYFEKEVVPKLQEKIKSLQCALAAAGVEFLDAPPK